jgi:hypothetical protein
LNVWSIATHFFVNGVPDGSQTSAIGKQSGARLEADENILSTKTPFFIRCDGVVFASVIGKAHHVRMER